MKVLQKRYKYFLLFFKVAVLAALTFSWQKIEKFIEEFSIEKPYSKVKISNSYFESMQYFKVDLPEQLSMNVLSATQLNSANFIWVFIITVLVWFIVTVKFDLDLVSKITLLLITFIGNNFLLLAIDEPIDELYVWAAKVDSFIESGRLGVVLYDGSYGESTAGFLQFLIAVIPRLVGLTVEQSLYVPLLFFLTISISVVFIAVLQMAKSKLLAVFTAFLIYLNPVLVRNYSFGFDNVLGFSFLVLWTFFEICTKRLNKLPIRLAFALIFPIVRLDFVIVSVGIFFLHLFENKLFRLKDLYSEYKANKKTILFLLFGFIGWIIYKLWAFGQLVPAMAKYKGNLNSNIYLLFSGLDQTQKSFNLDKIFSPVVFLFFVIWILLNFSSRNLINSKKNDFDVSESNFTLKARLDQLILLNFIFLLFSLLTHLNAGGDYFGYRLMRYQFPFVLNLILIFLFKFFLSVKFFRFFSLIDKSFFLVSFSALFLFISIVFYRPFEVKSLVKEVQGVTLGKTTCDFGAANAITSLKFIDTSVVATPEVNGFPYHLDSKVSDLYGLVDSRFIKDSFVGNNSANKFRIIPSDSEVSKTTLVWLYPSSECTNLPNWFSDLGEINSDPKYQIRRLENLVNSSQGFRVIDFNKYIEIGIRPVVVNYSFFVQGEKYFGQAYFFAKIKN